MISNPTVFENVGIESSEISWYALEREPVSSHTISIYSAIEVARIPDSGITGKICSPMYLPHQFDVTSVLDMLKVWVELCSVRPMKVGEKGKQKDRFKCKTSRFRRFDEL